MTDLFTQANNDRNNGQIDRAIKRYLEIAANPTTDLADQVEAWHLAAVSAKAAVSNEGSYYRDAISYLKKAETLARQLIASAGVLGAIYRDWGILVDAAGKTNEAPSWFQKSIELLQTSPDRGQLGMTYAKLGQHFYLQNNFSTAEEYLVKGIALLQTEPDYGFFHATSLADLARINYKLDRYDQALDLALTSQSWFSADHDSDQFAQRMIELHGVLSLIYFQLGQEKEAHYQAEAFQAGLKKVDPTVATVLQHELERLATKN